MALNYRKEFIDIYTKKIIWTVPFYNIHCLVLCLTFFRNAETFVNCWHIDKLRSLKLKQYLDNFIYHLLCRYTADISKFLKVSAKSFANYSHSSKWNSSSRITDFKTNGIIQSLHFGINAYKMWVRFHLANFFLHRSFIFVLTTNGQSSGRYLILTSCLSPSDSVYSLKETE